MAKISSETKFKSFPFEVDQGAGVGQDDGMTLRPLRSADRFPTTALLRRGAILPGGLLIFLAAAGPAPQSAAPLQVEIADSGPLGIAQSSVATAPAPKLLTVTPAGLEPAPVPDPDAGGPLATSGVKGASLAPAFFSQKAEFAGDGFVGRSSSDDTTDRRRQPAAGLGLSIPVQQ